MRRSTTDKMDDYDAVVMGVLEPIFVLSVMAVIALAALGGAIIYEPPCARIVRELHRDGVEANWRNLSSSMRELSPVQPSSPEIQG